MRVFKIRVARHKGKRVEVTRYLKTASGVEIQVKYNVSSTAGKQLRWVQTVSENGSFYKDCKMRTYVNLYGKGGSFHMVALPGVPGTCKADDLKPFYYTDAELAAGSGHLTGLLKLYVRYFRGIPDVELDAIKYKPQSPSPGGRG